MKKVDRSEILPIEEYEKVRRELTQQVIAARAARRTIIGDKVSIGFENHDTVRYQIQEMCRVERIREDAKVQEEVDTYNELLPDTPDELWATMLIEIDDEPRLKATLPKLVGIENSVRMKVGDSLVIPAKGEEGRSREDYTSSVHYLRFRFPPEAREALRKGDQSVWIEIDHPNYGASARLSPEAVAALAEDLS
ncbi:MAG TPA: DUF3501 family protein [Dehalococcoidia bacterium]|nr:DUF3501 family protein [Dehalococcoidia bacterium]